MNDKDIINSVNLYANTNFPYLVLNVIGEDSYPRNAGFQTVHWHEDLQFIYILDGTAEVKTLTDFVMLTKGEGLFLNKNVVHYIDERNCHSNSFVFPDYFLKFYSGSPAEIAVNRIVGNSSLPIYKFSFNENWHSEILEKLNYLSMLEECKDELYPLRVLCALSALWLIFQSNITVPESTKESLADMRIKIFLDYMHGHYAERISLETLSKAANVSVSEVLRCFKLCMHTTPYQYLTGLRLQKAAALLKETDEPMINIIDSVGFSSLSHFGKYFKAKTGLSPSDYRKRFKN